MKRLYIVGLKGLKTPKFKMKGILLAIEINSTKGAAKRKGIKMMVIGPSGIGKTHLAKSTGKTLILSAESGDLTLNDIDADSIAVKSLSQLREAYDYANEHRNDYDSLIVDSITEIGEMVVAELKKDPEYSSQKDSMKLWMRFSELMLGIAKSFRDIDGLNVIILALPESIKNGFEEKIFPLIPAKKVQAKLGSLYDIVTLIRINEEGQREFVFSPMPDFDAKDRSGKLDPVMAYDKELGLKPVFDKILN